MPTYTYHCTNPQCPELEKVVEVIHRMSEPKPNCPKCNVMYETIHNTKPTVRFIGNWMANGKNY